MEEQKLLKRKRKALHEGNKVSLSYVSIDLAEFYFRECRYEEAIEEYSVVADIYENMDNKKIDYARVNRMIGEAYTHLRQFNKALAHQQIHLDIAKKQADKLEQQRALATIGNTYLKNYSVIPDKNALQLAYKSFMKSFMICESLTSISRHEHMDMSARLLNNLGIVQEYQGNYDKGIELVKKSLNICKAHDLFAQLELGYSTLGSLYTRKEQYNEALHYYNLAIEAAGRLDDKILLRCASLLAKAEILIKLADYRGAKTILLKAHKLKHPNIIEREVIEHNLKVVASMCYTEDSLLTARNTDYKVVKKLYETLGDGACDLKNYAKGIEYYKEMLNAAEKSGDTGKDLSPCYISLGQTYSDNKQYDLALEYFQKDYNTCRDNPKEAVNTLFSIANTMEMMEKDLNEINIIYSTIRSNCQAIKDKQLEGKMLTKQLNLLKKYNRYHEATQVEEILNNMDYVPSESDSENTEDEGTPNIGDDICIDDITDESDGSDAENDLDKPRLMRKRSKGFAIKKNNKGETQLHTACIAGNATLVRRLLDNGHVVNIRDHCGWLPIHEACICGHKEIVQMLIEKGAAINDRGGTLCNGMTPLHDASSNGHLEIIQLMLDKGASAIAKNDNGETPLYILKKWRKTVDLGPTQLSLFKKLVERMNTAIEKSGHGHDKALNDKKNDALVVNELDISSKREKLASKQKSRRFPEKSEITTNKPIQNELGQKKNLLGSLRRGIGMDDLDQDAPSTSHTFVNISSDDSSNSVESFSHFHKQTSNSESDKDVETNARDEYRKVMEDLRYRSKTNENKKRKSHETARSAYLGLEEVGDDWLENDLNINLNKRRKTSAVDGLINTVSTRNVGDFTKNQRSRHFSENGEMVKSIASTSNLSHNSSKNRLDDDIIIPDEFFEPDFKFIEATTSIRKSNDDTNNSGSKNKRKSQTSLIEAGFSRHRSSSPTTLNNDNVLNQAHKRKSQTKLINFGHTRSIVEADSTTGASSKNNKPLESIQNTSIIKTVLPHVISEPMLAVDVRISGKLYRVPVPLSETHTRTIKWLAEEASKRYARKECMQPTLELESKNGAMLAEDDLISILFMAGSVQAEEVQAKIIKWNLPSLAERYRETCCNMNSVPDENLLTILQETSTTLNLSNYNLRNKLSPLCKAMYRQNNLHDLNLSGNFMLNDCIHLLCNSLPTLTNLLSLDLQLNNLNAESLKYMADMFSQSEKHILENLSHLNLSYNPLADESLQYLAVITRYLKLQTLKLACVGFTQTIFENYFNRNVDLCLNYVENFDISNNHLGKNQISTFLSWLECKNVVKLNISNNRVQDLGLLKDVVEYFRRNGSVPKLKELNCSRCHITDCEVFELLTVLTQAEAFETLNLSYNEDLTGVSFRRLLQHQPFICDLDITGCKDIFKYFGDSRESAWIFSKSRNMKSLKLSTVPLTHGEECKTLINMCKNEYKDRCKVRSELKDFLHLTVSD